MPLVGLHKLVVLSMLVVVDMPVVNMVACSNEMAAGLLEDIVDMPG